MIKVFDITKSYGQHVIFKDLSFNINKGERVGLVGRNGNGKTTLFQILLGKIAADEGSVSIPKDYRLGYLEQHISFSCDTALKEGCLGLREGDKNSEWKVEKILSGLGFSKEDMQKHPSMFSGGFQIRLNLAKLLVSNPDLILLDEPNNYLDIVAIRWLSNFLKAWKNELILITHDRGFMDSITTHTMIIHRQKIRKIEGNTEKLYDQIAKEEEIYEKTRVNDDKKRRQTELFIRKFRAKARLGGLVQSRIKCLAKQKKNEQLEKIENLDFSFHSSVFPAAQMMGVHNICFSYSKQEPYLINNFSINIGKKERICIIGKNGKGKSTLLKILAGNFAYLSGNIKTHPCLKTGYFCQTNSANLNPQKTIFEEIMSADDKCLPQTARNIAGAMMFPDDMALKKIGVISGGEKSRVLLGKLLVTPSHLLLLDEPTNHLDMESCDALIDAINEFDGSVVMVTHNEMYLHAIASRLIIFDEEKISVFEGTYQDFLDNIGWQDERDTLKAENKAIKSKSAISADITDRKVLKKLKAELLQQKSQTLRPMEAKIKNIEDSITSMETEINNNTELLVKASNEGDIKLIAELPKKINILRPEIENLYELLDKITSEYEQAFQSFEQRMKNME